MAVRAFYRVDVAVFEVVADVDEYNFTIKGTKPTETELSGFSCGSMGTEANARAAFEGAVDVVKAASAINARLKPAEPTSPTGPDRDPGPRLSSC